MSRIPDTWTEVYERLAVPFGRGPYADAVAHEFVREALEAKFGVQDPTEMRRARRALALQRLVGVLFAAEESGGYDLCVGVRREVCAIFARYFDGVVLEGPPWRLDPTEEQLPTYEEWCALADF